MDCAIAHNGDISSFGANLEQLNSWGLRSHVGTDSEVIARLLDHLVRVEHLSLFDAATLMTNPFDANLAPDVRRLLNRYRGARLDGPFAVVAGFSDGDDTYLLALTDRSKFRPLLIGEDDREFYVASEEVQIRNLSKDATVWAPEPGSFFLASVKKGMLEPGTRRKITRSVVDRRRSGDGPRIANFARDRSRPSTRRASASADINEFLKKAYRTGQEGVKIDNARRTEIHRDRASRPSRKTERGGSSRWSSTATRATASRTSTTASTTMSTATSQTTWPTPCTRARWWSTAARGTSRARPSRAATSSSRAR